MSISWDPPSYEHRNGPNLQYSVNVSHVESSFTSYKSVSSTSAIFTSLHPDYVYTCEVAAENSAGQGPFRVESVRMPEACELEKKKKTHCNFL